MTVGMPSLWLVIRTRSTLGSPATFATKSASLGLTTSCSSAPFLIA